MVLLVYVFLLDREKNRERSSPLIGTPLMDSRNWRQEGRYIFPMGLSVGHLENIPKLLYYEYTRGMPHTTTCSGVIYTHTNFFCPLYILLKIFGIHDIFTLIKNLFFFFI